MADSQSGGGENVFLVQCDAENFERTVTTPVDLTDYDDRPEALQSADEARLWGTSEGTRNAQNFERMAPGDLLLFYREETYVGVGRVDQTFEDEAGWVGETLWDGEPLPYVYTVTGFTPLSIDRAAVHRLFGYDASYSPGELLRVAPDRVTASLPAIELAVERFDER